MTVATHTIRLHGPDEEGVVTVEMIDLAGNSRAVFVDKDDVVQQCDDLLNRVDHGGWWIGTMISLTLAAAFGFWLAG